MMNIIYLIHKENLLLMNIKNTEIYIINEKFINKIKTLNPYKDIKAGKNEQNDT